MAKISLRRMYNSSKNRIAEEFSRRSVFAMFLIFWSLLPARAAEIEWWTAKIRWIAPHLFSPFGRVALIVCGFAIIVWDYRRHKRPKPHDPETLKGRTLILRDEMQAFLDSAPPATKITPGMTSEEILGTAFTDPRPPKLRHGYHLRFEERVLAIYHELGERNIEEHQLVRVGFIREDDYVAVIQTLTDLSERQEVEN